MPRKRINRSPPVEKKDDVDDDDFLFDDSQSSSGKFKYISLRIHLAIISYVSFVEYVIFFVR